MKVFKNSDFNWYCGCSIVFGGKVFMKLYYNTTKPLSVQEQIGALSTSDQQRVPTTIVQVLHQVHTLDKLMSL